MKKVILILTLVLTSIVNSSECYSYHTSEKHLIKKINGNFYLITRVIDPNGVSIASQQKIKIDIEGVKNLEYVSEDKSIILVVSENAYYWIDKNPYTFEDIGLVKITDRKNVSETFSTKLFCINGNWNYFSGYRNKITSKKITDFPSGSEIIYDFGRGSYLLKNAEKVSVYNELEGTIKVIPKLNSKNVRFKKANWDYDNHFLYDEDTFYLININFQNLENITSSFTLQGFSEFFTDSAFIVDDWYNSFLSCNDGTIWLYNKHTFTDNSGNRLYFKKYQDLKLLNNSNFLIQNNKVYRHNFRNPVDVSEVLDLKNLRKHKKFFAHKDFYTDGKGIYFFDFIDTNGNTKLKKIDLSLETKCYKGIQSYAYQSAPFYADNHKIFLWSMGDKKLIELTDFSSEIKDLSLAYAFDNKILIEGKIIESIADRETLEFIGSTVDVISDCDGGEGQYPVEVEYNYYFKDKNSVYSYHSEDKKLTKLDSVNHKTINTNNFLDIIK